LSYKNLDIWKLARELVIDIHKMTIGLLKSQISNYKYQTISNDRNSKIQTMSRLGRFWLLNIGI